jgi:glyoxylase-like metal-dependent hydrolase (beta-lactamase superfamily II)
VDLGDRTVVFDTLFLPIATHELRAAAEELTKRSVSIVINSHSHYDHIWGNQVFSPEALMISTDKTREMIHSNGQNVLDRHRRNASENLETARKEYDAAAGTNDREQAHVWVEQYEAFLENHATLQVLVPDAAFTDRLALHGSRRSAELIQFGNGHTSDDCVLFVQEERILFMGDLLFIGFHPVLGTGDPENWMRLLTKAQEMNPAVAVPGHGPVGTASDLKAISAYIAKLDEICSKMVNDGVPEERIDEEPPPAPYDNWLYARFFYGNMHFLYKKHSSVVKSA